MEAIEILGTITEKAKSNAVAEVRDCRLMAIGQVVRQGDIYLHRVPDDHLRGERIGSTNQLVPGVTHGSRHIAEGGVLFAGTTRPTWCAEETILGPCLMGPATITHPEHAHVLLGEGTFQVTYQMDARTLERVQD